MASKNNFNLVLHAHIPFVKNSEAEFWIYEAALNSYLPFLSMLQKITQETKNFTITLNVSPILLLQLDGLEFHEKFQQYVSTRYEILALDLQDPKKNKMLSQKKDELDHLMSIYYQFKTIPEGFKIFKNMGVLNILTSAFTHPLLPMMKETPELLNLQISFGKMISEYYFGEVKGFWSPECGTFKDLPKILNSHKLDYFFADPMSVKYNNVNIYQPFESNNVRYFVRDLESTNIIWDSNYGFPSHSDYQDFHYDISNESSTIGDILKKYHYLTGGFSIRSVTDINTNDKQLYEYDEAIKQVKKDALFYIDFLSYKFNQMDDKQKSHTLTVCFDMELFGHWWKEGIEFLYWFIKNSIDKNAFNIAIDLEEESCIEILPQMSSWGKNSNFESWINNQTQDIWHKLINKNFKAEQHLESLSLHNMLALLVSQSSDWTFLISYNSFTEMSKKMVVDDISYKRILPLSHIVEQIL